MIRKRGDVEIFRAGIAGEGLLVISVPSAQVDVSRLTAAERAVTSDAAKGLSNLQIAKRRRRALRTVANQLASAFRKLGVTSRADLAARFARGHAQK